MFQSSVEWIHYSITSWDMRAGSIQTLKNIMLYAHSGMLHSFRTPPLFGKSQNVNENMHTHTCTSEIFLQVCQYCVDVNPQIHQETHIHTHFLSHHEILMFCRVKFSAWRWFELFTLIACWHFLVYYMQGGDDKLRMVYQSAALMKAASEWNLSVVSPWKCQILWRCEMEIIFFQIFQITLSWHGWESIDIKLANKITAPTTFSNHLTQTLHPPIGQVLPACVSTCKNILPPPTCLLENRKR